MRPVTLAFLGAVTVACVAMQVAGSAQTPKLELSKAEQEVVDLTNATRKKENLTTLKVSPLLCEVARAHSANMAKKKKLEHVLDGKTAFQRIKASGYAYTYAGENLAAGDAPVPKIVEGWMDSKLHRDNILKGQYTEIGVGVVVDVDGQSWYTQVFAHPKPKSN